MTRLLAHVLLVGVLSIASGSSHAQSDLLGIIRRGMNPVDFKKLTPQSNASVKIEIPKSQVPDVQESGQLERWIQDNPSAFPELRKGVVVTPQQATTNFSGTDLDVKLFARDDVQDLASQITATLSRSPQAKDSILGDLQSRFQTKRDQALIFDIASAKISVADISDKYLINFTAPAKTVSMGVNTTLAAKFKETKRSDRKIIPSATIEMLALAPGCKTVTNSAKNNRNLEEISKALCNFVDSLGRYLEDQTEKNNEEFLQKGAEFREAYFRSWPTLRNDPQARDIAAAIFNGLARQGQLKAVYGVETNFEPPSYEDIFRYSRRVIRLENLGESCSGLAIGDNWILTAGHCFATGGFDEVRVVVDLDRNGTTKRRVEVVDLWPNPPPGRSSPDKLDYAFVRMKEDPAVSSLFDLLEKNGSEICFRTQSLGYREPVFSVGYPGSNSKKVHDYSYVWFPYKIADDSYIRLEAEMTARARIVALAFGDSSYTQYVLDTLSKAYRAVQEQGQTNRYYFGGARETAERPTFGIDTDTLAGDSGGPVFDRRSGCIVGIFTGGQSEKVIVTEASWRQHEFAAPITEVLTAIRATGTRQKVGDQDPQDSVIQERQKLLDRLARMSR